MPTAQSARGGGPAALLSTHVPKVIVPQPANARGRPHSSATRVTSRCAGCSGLAALLRIRAAMSLRR